MSEDKVVYTALGSIIGVGAIGAIGVYAYQRSLGSTPIPRRKIGPADPIKFAIGKYDKAPSYGKEWRQATATDWTNPAFQAELVKAHNDNGGWALLEEPLVCNNSLCVAEGAVMIDGAPVVEVGFKMFSTQELRGVYPAMNMTTEEAWTATAPALGNNWSIWAPDVKKNISSPPCLFVHDSYNPSKATSLSSGEGGKKSRTRKHSRKQKRGTRK